MSFEVSAFIVTWLMIALLALAMSGLLRQIKLLSQRIEGGTGSPGVYPMVGRPLPELSNGSAPQIGSRRPALLVFASSDCQVCDERLAELSQLAGKHGAVADFGAVFSGSSNGARSETLKVFTQREHAFDELGIRVTPFGIVVRNGRIVNAQHLGSRDELQALLRTAGVEK